MHYGEYQSCLISVWSSLVDFSPVAWIDICWFQIRFSFPFSSSLLDDLDVWESSLFDFSLEFISLFSVQLLESIWVDFSSVFLFCSSSLVDDLHVSNQSYLIPVWSSVVDFSLVTWIIMDCHYLSVCLDGSAPGYHFQEGFGSGSDKWLVHIEVISHFSFLVTSFFFVCFWPIFSRRSPVFTMKHIFIWKRAIAC